MLHSPHVLACIKMSNLLLPSVNEDDCITLLLVVITLDLHTFQNVVSSLNIKGMICDSPYLFFLLKVIENWKVICVQTQVGKNTWLSIYYH